MKHTKRIRTLNLPGLASVIPDAILRESVGQMQDEGWQIVTRAQVLEYSRQGHESGANLPEWMAF
jgi:hypothetical protein